MSNSESNGIIKRTLSRRKFSMIAGGSVLLAACGDGDSAQPAATTTTAAPATTTEAAAPAVTTTIAPATTTTVAATTTTAAGAAPTTTTTAAPRPLKTLRFGYHARLPRPLTRSIPAYRTSSTDGLFQALVAEQLVREDANLTPTPHLAESLGGQRRRHRVGRSSCARGSLSTTASRSWPLMWCTPTRGSSIPSGGLAGGGQPARPRA